MGLHHSGDRHVVTVWSAGSGSLVQVIDLHSSQRVPRHLGFVHDSNVLWTTDPMQPRYQIAWDCSMCLHWELETHRAFPRSLRRMVATMALVQGTGALPALHVHDAVFELLCNVIAVSYTHLTLPTKRIV
eukprot:TRINITY_DN62186_c0_g1_i1.p2 TRINITY_DN62186_c0_g1~~TRINITY_DN62186_c0_g1_i1.p2  ORF type:complete len:130 (-),score=12.27 TRINITY_DN62186_c0_g1_i1:56-445(-)